MPLTEEERNQHFDTITNSETIADRALAIEALRYAGIEEEDIKAKLEDFDPFNN